MTIPQIKTLRKERKLSQRELAKKAGLAQALVSFIETGTRESYSLASLKKIAEALDCDLEILIKPR